MLRRRSFLALLLVMLLSFVPTWNVAVAAQEQQTAQEAPRCFVETGYCIEGPFRTQWETHGGLEINGYPISEEFGEVLEDGKKYTVQYFERARFEWHPENKVPYQVQLGQFGSRIHGVEPPVEPIPGRRFFPETGHTVGPAFSAFWDANGGLEQFGYPITELFDERLEDGRVYQVQYFERARFEWHPEKPAAYQVLLGQFGRRIYAQVLANRPPLLLAICQPGPGRLILDIDGAILFPEKGDGYGEYNCTWRVPAIEDPVEEDWYRRLLITNAALQVWDPGTGNYIPVKMQGGFVRLIPGASYRITAWQGSAFRLVVP